MKDTKLFDALLEVARNCALCAAAAAARSGRSNAELGGRSWKLFADLATIVPSRLPYMLGLALALLALQRRPCKRRPRRRRLSLSHDASLIQFELCKKLDFDVSY